MIWSAHRKLTKLTMASVTLVTAILASGCSTDDTVDPDTSHTAPGPDPVIATDALEPIQNNVSIELLPPTDTVVSASIALEIPYPVYPNSLKYRIGGEKGLKIVVFETSDTFKVVDEFYNAQHEHQRLLRVEVMPDYVRYTADVKANTGSEDAVPDARSDPGSTEFPGISIHEFVNSEEAISYGAAANSKTNIIMSYRSKTAEIPLLTSTD